MALVIAAMLFRFSSVRIERLDRKYKLYLGAVMVSIIGVLLIMAGVTNSDLKV
ncbi:MAG: hypothetical protein GYB35_14075 [Algicola sp.]|nr:hypothetical protein [Algicola sp.]